MQGVYAVLLALDDMTEGPRSSYFAYCQLPSHKTSTYPQVTLSRLETVLGWLKHLEAKLGRDTMSIILIMSCYTTKSSQRPIGLVAAIIYVHCKHDLCVFVIILFELNVVDVY